MALLDPMTLLKGLCLASGLAMHLAPLPVMREIAIYRSTLNYHIAPFAGPLLNHVVNLWYAVVRVDGPLVVHRVCGIAAQAYYISTFLRFVPPHKSADSSRWLSWVGAVLVGIALELHALLPLVGLSALYLSHLAFFAFITGIGLAASPLATVGEVLRTRDASSLPAHLCAMVTLQCCSWMVYGYLRDDLSTFANNLIGVALGSTQLGLIAFYGSSRAQRSFTGAAVIEKEDITSSSGNAAVFLGVAQGQRGSAIASQSAPPALEVDLESRGSHVADER